MVAVPEATGPAAIAALVVSLLVKVVEAGYQNRAKRVDESNSLRGDLLKDIDSLRLENRALRIELDQLRGKYLRMLQRFPQETKIPQ